MGAGTLAPAAPPADAPDRAAADQGAHLPGVVNLGHREDNRLAVALAAQVDREAATRSAQRLVLELRDKVGAVRGAGTAASGAPAPVKGQEPWRGQVAEALVGLGWSAKQASDAVERVAEHAPADAEIAALLRLALRELRP